MKALINLWIRSLAWPFYQANALFFLAGLYVAFGMIGPGEHAAIAPAIGEHFTFTLLVCGLWTLYIAKTTLFVRTALLKPSYRFMHQAALLNLTRQATPFVAAQFIVNLPVTGYALFIMYFQTIQGEFINMGVVILFLIASHALPAGYYLALLKKPYPEHAPSAIVSGVHKLGPKPYFSWFIIHLAARRSGLLFLSKLFSLLALSGFFAFYHSGDYDWRVIAFGALFAFGGNLALVQEHVRFENDYLAGFRNFPVSTLRRTANATLAWLIALLPELCLLAFLFPSGQSVFRYFEIAAWGLSWCLMWFSASVLASQEKLLRPHFAAFVFVFIYILYGFPMSILAIVQVIFFYAASRSYFRLIRDW